MLFGGSRYFCNLQPNYNIRYFKKTNALAFLSGKHHVRYADNHENMIVSIGRKQETECSMFAS